uniref:Uncharacterized protein n=1 Tax=Plectus sambesii TaxID=2011161 RepID=A0A914VVE8_9BILA
MTQYIIAIFGAAAEEAATGGTRRAPRTPPINPFIRTHAILQGRPDYGNQTKRSDYREAKLVELALLVRSARLVNILARDSDGVEAGELELLWERARRLLIGDTKRSANFLPSVGGGERCGEQLAGHESKLHGREFFRCTCFIACR